jgi:DNA-binding NarL/FixJ family response regulator
MNHPLPSIAPDKAVIRIFLVDDHVLFRQGLKRILESEEGYSVVGEASDGDSAVQLIPLVQPDIVLMDISMPTLNGMAATRKIKQVFPKAAVLLLTMHEDPFLPGEGLRMGASGYLLKKSADREVLKAINLVRAGLTYFPPLSPREKSFPPPSPLPHENLSSREKEILRHLANGKTNQEIARYLDISVSTVETHRRNLMKKLGFHNLSEIIRYALLHGIIQI